MEQASAQPNYITVEDDRVPALGFGTWQLTGKQCADAVADALAIGYRHIDTAEAYGNEEEVGRAIAQSGINRREIFVTTKVASHHLAYSDVLHSAAGSLGRLGLEYVDLLLIHWPSRDLSLDDTLAAFRRLKDEGRARHIGVSNFPPRLWREALEKTPVVCNQVEFHPLFPQDELLQMARRQDLFLTAYSPLAHGRVLHEPVILEIAEKHHKTAAQVVLRWLVQQDRVAAIPRAAGREHRLQDFAIFDFKLSEEEMGMVSNLTRHSRV